MNLFLKKTRNLVHHFNLYIKYYRPFGERLQIAVVYFIDEYKKDHGGMADRFKQILGLYAYCKAHNIPFKLVFTYPFELKKYLVPIYDWNFKITNPRNIFYSKPVYLGYISEFEQKKRLRLSNRQLHVYANSNSSMFIKEFDFNLNQ